MDERDVGRYIWRGYWERLLCAGSLTGRRVDERMIVRILFGSSIFCKLVGFFISVHEDVDMVEIRSGLGVWRTTWGIG